MIERAFVYGDLLFETIRVMNGEICFVNKHFNRLMQSAKVLKFETDLFTQQIFTDEILKNLAGKKDARVRFVLYRNSDGFYTPKSNSVKWQIEIFPLSTDEKICEKLGVFSEYKKSCQPLSNLKSGNALIYVLAGLFSKLNNFDDCLILNEYNRIAEATSSNVFMVKDETFYTPPLSEGCVNGVMRNIVIEKANKNGIFIIEKTISQIEFLNADEVFLTNVINGIISVKSFQAKIFLTNFTSKIKSFFDL